MSKQNKKCQVVMSAIDKGKLTLHNDCGVFSVFNLATQKIQHLYILSNEQIKDSDLKSYIYDTEGEVVLQLNNSEAIKIYNERGCKHWKKVISTTNPELHTIIADDEDSTIGCKEVSVLPEPSNEFIQHYITEYNKGNVIKEVNVEYGQYIEPEVEDYLKISSDNTITINFSVKESWDNIRKILPSTPELALTNCDDFIWKWLKENYKPPKKKN